MTAQALVDTASRPHAPVRRAVSSRTCRRPGAWQGIGVALLVGLCAQVPVLFNRRFYLTDDSAAQFLPMWHRLGERLLSGEWPLLLDLDSWMGGNLAAEALFGVWNPVNLANFALVASIDDLAVAATVVKTEFLIIIALGVYLLCREYRAAPWAAAVLAVSLPFSGFLLYFQAATWAGGLMGFAWVPWVWWSARRAVTGRGSVLVAVVFGALCVTNGEPYGALGVCVVLAALLVEVLLRGRGRPAARRGAWWLVGIGFCAAAMLPLVYLPLLGSTGVSWRGVLFGSGPLRPTLLDLLNAGFPTHSPDLEAFGRTRMRSPGTYFAWYALVLAPWLNWSVLRRRWRALAAPLLVAAAYTVLCLGPAHLWLWRWPLRHVVMLYLPLAIVAAVLLSAGLRRDRIRLRLLITAVILLAASYVAFSTTPRRATEHLIALAVLAGVTAVALIAARHGSRWLAVALQGGTVIVLVMQLGILPTNADVANFSIPTSVARLRADLADRPGAVVQIGQVQAIPTAGPAHAQSWHELAVGNTGPLAGQHGTVAYTGIGHKVLADALCLDHLGGTCADAYRRLWDSAVPHDPVLADLLGVRTVVVQRTLIDDPPVPPGWRVSERNDVVTVLSRAQPARFPDGRLSWSSPGVDVLTDVAVDDRTERVTFRRTIGHGPARLVFSRLAWPGYHATVDGHPVPVRSGPAGLLWIDLPDSLDHGTLELRFTPPGLTTGVVSAAAGMVLALLLAGYGARLRRRHRARART